MKINYNFKLTFQIPTVFSFINSGYVVCLKLLFDRLFINIII